MTHTTFQGVYPSPTTFCEVTYDNDWYEEDRHYTPYRYSLLRTDTDSNSDTVSLTLPSYTYYEYLRSLYDCRSTATPRYPPGYSGASAASLFNENPGRATTWHAFNKDTNSDNSFLFQGYSGASAASLLNENPGRATTWHAFNKDTNSELSRQAIRSEPTRIRPTYPFPSMHLLQQGEFGDELEDEIAVADRARQKLVWVDALNKWVPESQLHPRPYISFIGNAPVIEKAGRTPKELHGSGGGEAETTTSKPCDRYVSHMSNMGRRLSLSLSQDWGTPSKQRLYGSGWEVETTASKTCERYESHMSNMSLLLSPDRGAPSKLRNNEKRDAIRKKAQEMAEQQKQRKAYSTPLYTSLAERKLKARVQSSKAPHSSPASPVAQQKKPTQTLPQLAKQPSDPVPPTPREVWQANDTDKARREAKPPTHGEISTVPSAPGEMLQARDKAKREARSPVLALREISVRLQSGKQEDDSKEKPDKRVTFNEQRSQSPKTVKSTTKKKKEETDKDELDSNLKITKTDIDKEKEKAAEEERVRLKEKEKAAEEEKARLEALSREASPDKNGRHKSPSQMTQDQDNAVYEATMNAAAKRQGKVKAKPKTEKTEKPKKGRKEKERGEVKAPPPPPPPPPQPKPKTPKAPKVPKPPKEKKVADANQSQVKARATKPMLVGMKQAQKPPPAMAPNINKNKTERLPISRPSELQLDVPPKTPSPEPVPTPEEVKPKSPHQERRLSIIEQREAIKKGREIIKKEKRERRCTKKEEESEEKLQKLPDIEARKVDSWIYGDDNFSESHDLSKDLSEVQSPEPLPSLYADLSPEFIEKKKEQKEKKRKKVLAKLIDTESEVLKQHRRPGQLDSSYQDELRRLELAEARRKKQMEMYDRLKKGRLSAFGDVDEDGIPNFDDYGFLSKYCIFNQGNLDMYKHAFDAVDEDGAGWLEGQDVMIALRGANNRLTEAEEEYIYRVLELTGYKITHGADFKMFSVLAALSQKISALDKWMKNMIGKMDFKQLEMKMFKCKELWECNVDQDTNRITLDQLCVELRAGGVSLDHELEVRDTLAHLPHLDLLDFLTYVPLFIMIHEAVIENPLNDTRTK